MTPGPENHSRSSSQPERSESQPQQPKHTLHIEKQPTQETEQRKQWLKEMLPIKNGDTTGTIEHVRIEYARSLDVWNQDIPAQTDTIAALRRYDKRAEDRVGPRPNFLPSAMYEAHDKGDQQTIGKYQQLGRALVNRYSGRAENKHWQDLSEEHKRYVRFGEMAVLMGDTLKGLRALREQRTTPNKLAKLTHIVVSYADSKDIPASFSKMFAENLSHKVSQMDSRPKSQPRPNVMPGDAFFSAIDGRAPGGDHTFQDLWDYAYSEPTHQPPQTTVETTYVENTGNASPSNPPDNVIETEFNPATGTYEPSGEKYTNPPSNPEGPKGNSSAATPTPSPSAPSAPAPPSAPPA